jgi:hypothetical protein
MAQDDEAVRPLVTRGCETVEGQTPATGPGCGPEPAATCVADEEMHHIGMRLGRWLARRHAVAEAGGRRIDDADILLVEQAMTRIGRDDIAARRLLLESITRALADGSARHPLALALAARLLGVALAAEQQAALAALWGGDEREHAGMVAYEGLAHRLLAGLEQLPSAHASSTQDSDIGEGGMPHDRRTASPVTGDPRPVEGRPSLGPARVGSGSNAAGSR